jgi:hypothetical protein
MMKRVRLATDPVRVSREVFEGLEAVRLSGLTNMLDRPAVIRIAAEMGYDASAAWLRENRDLYARGIFQGFEADAD